MSAPKWEYLVEHVGSVATRTEELLDKLGKDGWNLIGLGRPDEDGDREMIFIRPREESNSKR